MRKALRVVLVPQGCAVHTCVTKVATRPSVSRRFIMGFTKGRTASWAPMASVIMMDARYTWMTKEEVLV